MAKHTSKPTDTNVTIPHTPKPWRVRRWTESNGLETHTIYGPDDIEIASLSYTNGPEDADADLIAAAPDMKKELRAARSRMRDTYAAAVKASEAFKTDAPHAGHHLSWYQVAESMKRGIASIDEILTKAEGETNT